MRHFTVDRYSSRAIGTAQCVSSMDVVHNYLKEQKELGNGLLLSNNQLLIRTEADAAYIKEMINCWNSESMVLLNIKGLGVDEPLQEFDYIKSNLRGFIFYFICKDCEKKVKYLYLPVSETKFRCRSCHGLKYPRTYKKLKSFPEYISNE